MAWNRMAYAVWAIWAQCESVPSMGKQWFMEGTESFQISEMNSRCSQIFSVASPANMLQLNTRSALVPPCPVPNRDGNKGPMSLHQLSLALKKSWNTQIVFACLWSLCGIVCMWSFCYINYIPLNRNTIWNQASDYFNVYCRIIFVLKPSEF